ADPDIDIYSALRNGYGHITINCRDYPLNISGLRRAFAFAFDKTRVTTEIFDGFSQQHDSLVPYTNGWCIEEEFDWHYYSNQSDLGNMILDDLSFAINQTTGFRQAPNGEHFNIEILGGFEDPFAGGDPDWISYEVARIGVDSLHSLHINATVNSYPRYTSIIEDHGEYDMVVYSENFEDYNVDWLAFEYWSEYADTPYQNPTNFANDTYDFWRDQLLYSTTYEDVYEAAAEMQKILHYNVPRLVVYENTYLQAYRSDQFSGHIEALGRNIADQWTMRKIQKLDGTQGGTVQISISEDPDSFNIFLSESPSTALILDNLYSSLYKRGPDLTPWPDLAEDMLIETHSDNSEVPDGHTRFTFDLIQNASWSDREVVTAEDVASSLTYAFESTHYGNPAGTDIGDLVAAYAPTPDTLIVEFSTESYWHFSTFAYDYVIPEHIFKNDGGIGYENWDSWNPVFNYSHPHVTCGPFTLIDYEDGEFYELVYNPSFHYGIHGVIIPHPPYISSQGDITYEIGSMGNVIRWYISDDNPDTYLIQLNGDTRETGQCSNNRISHYVDGLWLGDHTITLTVTDYSGFSSTNSVQVSVIEPTGTLPITPLKLIAISISLFSVTVILSAAISIYWKKRTQETS
ncbi:MAG: hypothetical protein E4H14_20055, partial [Candidatus Thorarchaeota archaeon]